MPLSTGSVAVRIEAGSRRHMESIADQHPGGAAMRTSVTSRLMASSARSIKATRSSRNHRNAMTLFSLLGFSVGGSYQAEHQAKMDKTAPTEAAAHAAAPAEP
jgi:hypothetical protein